MNILFIGWGDGGFKCLKALVNNGLTVSQVVAPENYEIEEMKILCKKHDIPIINFRSADYLMNKIKKTNPNLIIIASFPKILPREIIFYPKFGTINVHTGELPKYRGYHPLNWAIIRDEKRVGVTVHYVGEKVDSGDILAQKTIVLKNEDTINTIKESLTRIGADLLVQVIKKIKKAGTKIKGKKQIESLATYAPKRIAEDGKINWQNNTRDIFNLIRALKTPYPNAFSFNKKGEKIEFKESYLYKITGKVLAKVRDHYLISTGDGVILLKTKYRLKMGEFLK